MKAVIRAARPCRAARALLALLLCAFTLVQPALAASASAPRLRVVPGLAEPLVASRPTSAAEDAALDAALAVFKAPADPAADFPERAASLEAFAREHPRSGWRGAILANLGVGYYQAGYFSRAMAAWEQAWEAARDTRVDASPAARALADRALGELARMHARLGRADDLQALLASIRGREVTGGATELIAGAREALWNFRNDPGRSFLCGPMALRNLLVSAKAPASRIDLMDAQRSGPGGFSLAQVSALARRAGIAHRLIHRQGGQAIPVPSVVHWKLDHYAAIVAQQDGRYLVQDPTFASGDTWVSARAIEEESSGYFLVPEGMGQARAGADPGWRLASAQEARRIHGKGQTSNSEEGNTTSGSESLRDVSCNRMCETNAKRMLVSLNLTDTPVGYNPPKGPPVQIRLSYNQRESGQPAVFGFFNVSPKWSMSVLSWIEDDPARPGNGVVRFAAGGGHLGPQDYVNYSSASGTFRPERKSGAVLARLPATGAAASYELRHSDGSRHVYAHADGATVRPRRMFLSQIIDPAGNALTFNYDAQLRLASITDATGRHTTFSYDAPASPLLVSRITDPFGRHADLGYDGQGRLVSITDVIGITSAFSYDASGLINAMTTPYGTSRFAYGQSAAINGRYLEITDPLGLTERLEFRHGAAGIPASEAAIPSVQGPLANNNLNNRNTFYWDKHAQAVAPGQYAAARITHWLHNPAGLTSPIVESTKAPLESRVWRQYPGQTGSGYSEGTSGLPHRISRVLDGGITQLTRFERNAWGKPTAVTDPAGRILHLGYADNGIDLVSVQRQGPTGAAETLATFTYDHRHLPLTHTDAAGQTTRYAWDGAGLLESVTDPLGQTTRYARDGLGRLTAIVNPDGSTRLALEYDAFDRVARSTDSEGYARTFEYDALDRLTRVGYPDGTSTEYTYDRLDLVAVRDRLGRTTRYAWDANRRLVSRTDPLGQTTAYAWHPNGALAAITDPKGHTTTWDIDLQGRPVAKRHADGSTETYAWNISGQLAAVTDAQGQRRTYAYTVDGLPAAIGYPGAQVPTAGVSYGYDSVHPRVTTMTDGVGTTTYAWHPAGTPGALQLAGVTVPVAGAGGLSETQSYTYDALGRQSGRSIAPSQGQGHSAVETFSYDALGRRIAHGNPLGEFRYSHLGASARVTGVRSANGPLVQMRYDTPLGDLRLRGIGYADAGGHPLAGYGYRYDAEGNVLEFAEALPGKALEGAVVPLPPSSSPPAASPRTAAPAAPVFAVAAFAALALAVALWPARRLRPSRLRRWARVGAPLLALSLAASCGGGGSGGTGGWWPGGSSGDGAGGGPVGTAPGSGAGTGAGAGAGTGPGTSPGAPAEPRARVTTYTYDAAERLTSASTALDLPGSPAGPLRRFEWDAASNLVGIAVGDSTRQLPANATNALAEGSYDASGNPLKLGASTFQWDGAHRLVEHDNGAVQSSFTYDGQGRVVRIVERMGGAVVADRAYVWCGTVRCVERDNTLPGSPVTRRYFEQGVLDLRTEPQGQALYYAQDALGSVRQLIDAQGNVRARYDYEPFGQRSRTEGDLASQLGFAGLWRHDASGLDLAVWRGYDASRGRWLNRDPIGEDGGLNLYGYVEGNPINYVDPDGLQAVPMPSPWGPVPWPVPPGSGSSSPSGLRDPDTGNIIPSKPLPLPWVDSIRNACSSAADRLKDWMFSDGQRPSKTPNTGTPGSTVVNPGSGQERGYGDDGWPAWDVDWDQHHGPNTPVPHGHEWSRDANGRPIRGGPVPIQGPWKPK